MDSLKLCVMSVVDHDHHQPWLVNEDLKSFKRKLVRVVVNVQNFLLVNRFLLRGQTLILLFIEALDHVLWVNEGAKVKSSCLKINIQELKNFVSKGMVDKLFNELKVACVRDLLFD
jgi:hypothetical protein